MKNIEVGKSYKTRGGKEVRVYAIDGSGSRSIHGAILRSPGQWLSALWCEGGSFYENGTDDWDIVITPLKYEGEATVMGFGDDINSTIFVPSEFEGLKVKFTLEALK